MNKVEEKQTFAPKEEIEEKVSGKLLASIYIIYVNSADSIITNPPFCNGQLGKQFFLSMRHSKQKVHEI